MDSTSNTREKSSKKKQHASDQVENAQVPTEGTSWQFYVVLAVVGIGILGLIARTIGLF